MMKATLSFAYLMAGVADVAKALPTGNERSAVPTGVPEFVVKHGEFFFQKVLIS